MRKVLLPACLGVLAIAASAPSGPTHPKIALLFRVAGHTSRISPAVTQGGRRIYYVQDSTDLFMIDRGTGRSVHIMAARFLDGSSLTTSPAGDRLAFCRYGETGDVPQLWSVALNPTTGLAAGPAHRVSMLAATDPAFSPDGQWIAFGARASATAENLVVVPVNGGPERVVANTSGDVYPVSWRSPATIQFGVSYDKPADDRLNGVYRVPVAGGEPTLVMRTGDWGQAPGLSPDGHAMLVWDSTWDSVVVASASGKRIAAYEPQESEPTPDSWADAMHAIGIRSVAPRSVRILDVGSGASRPAGDSAQAYVQPVWSPDGRRFAVLWNNARLLLEDADGANRTVIRLQRPIQSTYSLAWSPDARQILYQTRDSGSLRVIDLASHRERVIATTSRVGPPPVWRSDARAVLFATLGPAVRSDSVRTVHIHEAGSDGDRVIRSFDAHCGPAPHCGKFLNDSILVTWDSSGYRFTNFRTGAERIRYARQGVGTPVPTLSSNHKWMTVRVNGSGKNTDLVVMRTEGGEPQKLSFGTKIAPGPENPWISPDGSTLVIALLTEDGGQALYKVDVASGKRTPIATLAKTTRQAIDRAVSPDGRFVVYTEAVSPHVDFYGFDFSSILR